MLKNKYFIFGLVLSLLGVVLITVAFANIIDPFYYVASACFYLGASTLVYSFVKEVC